MSHPAAVLFAVALTASLFLRPGLRTRTIFFSSLIGLMLALISDSPVRIVGDGIEYAAMANNLSHLARPSLTAEQLQSAGKIVSGAADAQLEKPWLKGSDRRQDFPHFWLYSLLAAPFVRLADLLGANPLTGFTMLNVLLMIALAALLVARASPAAALLVVAGPVLWWTDKAHTEVFTSVMLATALVLLRTSPWWSILAAGMAAGQNPALLIAMAAIMAVAMYQGWRDRRIWLASVAALSVAAAHPLYYYSRLGVWTGIYDSVDRHLPSFRELIAVLFDVNLGVLIHDPLLFAVVVIAGVEAVTRPKRKPFDIVDGTIAFIAFALIVIFTQTTNVNSGGTPGPSRYGLWLVPFAIPIVAGVRPDASWFRVLSAGAMAWCAWSFAPSLPDQYLKPSVLAAEVWTRWPDLDNPVAEVFAERTIAREPARPPVASAGCQKILLVGDGTGATWPPGCPTAALPDFCQAKDVFCYANRTAAGYRFVQAPYTPAWQFEVLHPTTPRWNDGMLVVAQTAETPMPMAAWQSEGWSYTERLDQPNTDPVSQQWRWIQERAQIGIMMEAAAAVRLKITARSINRPRRLRVSAGSTEIATLLIQTDIAEHQTNQFELPAGTSVITLESLEPGESPASGDSRRLSIAVFRIEIVATKR
jgi:hypothetical protein